jgi:hypothetical protein
VIGFFHFGVHAQHNNNNNNNNNKKDNGRATKPAPSRQTGVKEAKRCQLKKKTKNKTKNALHS